MAAKPRKKPAKAKEGRAKTGAGGEAKKEVNFPNVKPPSLSERNMPPKPHTVRVCGNVIPVRNGIAGEADPKKLRRIAKEKARRRGEKPDETRI